MTNDDNDDDYNDDQFLPIHVIPNNDNVVAFCKISNPFICQKQQQ